MADEAAMARSAKRARQINHAIGGILKEITKRNFLTQIDARYLGSYDPSDVPYSIKKKMSKDPQVALGIAARQAPLVAAWSNFTVQSQDEEYAAFVKAAMKPVIRSLAKSSLRAELYGHAPHEKIFIRDDVQGEMDVAAPKAGTGDAKVKREWKGAIVYRKLKDLEPWNTSYWYHRSGGFAAMRYGGSSGPFVPAAKSFIYTNNKQFENLYGNALLENVYDDWYKRSVMVMFLCRYMEKKADPTTLVYAPASDVEEDPDGTERSAVHSAAKEISDNVQNSATVGIPAIFDEDGNRLFDVKVLEYPDRSELFLAVINYFDVRILRGLLTPERVVTQDTNVGTNSMASAHTGTFLRMTRAALDDVTEQFNLYVVPDLAKYNGSRFAGRKASLVPAHGSLVDEQLLSKVLDRAMMAEATLARAIIQKDPALMEEGGDLLIQLLDGMGALQALGMPVKQMQERKPLTFNAKAAKPTESGDGGEKPDEKKEKPTESSRQIAASLEAAISLRRDYYDSLDVQLDRASDNLIDAPDGISDLESVSAKHAFAFIRTEMAKARGPKRRDKIRGPFWRPLTRHEQLADKSLQEIHESLDLERQKYIVASMALWNRQKDKMVSHVRDSFKSSKIEATLRDFTVDDSVAQQDAMIFAQHVKDGYLLGQKTAHRELDGKRRLKAGEKEKQRKQERAAELAALAALTAYAHQVVESRYSDARKEFILASTTAYKARRGSDQAGLANSEQDAERNVGQYLILGGVLIGTMATTGYIRGLNDGREVARESFDATSQMVRWAQYSALLNITTSILGDWMDGRIISPADGDYRRFLPPLYENSRSMMIYVPAWADQPNRATVPAWSEIPPEIKAYPTKGNFPEIYKRE